MDVRSAPPRSFATATEAFADYLAAHNRQDLDGVLAHLHADCEVYFLGKAVHKGRESFKHKYEEDFARQDVVRVASEVREERLPDGRLGARVLLVKDGSPPVTVDVTYVFEGIVGAEGVGQMVRHEIHSVK